MNYYIYKYVDNEEIIYIGQTNNLNKRINQHTKDKLEGFNGKIYYFECPNKTAMDSWEYCLINKYHPAYNVALNDDNTNINIEEPQWIPYISGVNIIASHPVVKPHREIRLLTQKEIEFRCSRCYVSFKDSHWRATPKGFSADCPYCRYAVWISKEKARSQWQFQNEMAMIKTLVKGQSA